MGSTGLVLRLLVVFAYVAACCAFGFSFGSKDPPTTAAPVRRAPPPPPPLPTIPARSDNPEPHYTFHYVVQDARTGDFKTQEERRDGGKVRGTYSVTEPNGDLRVVSYSSDSEGGFRAEVRVEPGGAVLAPTDDGRTFSSFFPDPFKLFRTPPVFSGQPPEVSSSPLTLLPVFEQQQPFQPNQFQPNRFQPQIQNPQYQPNPKFQPNPQFQPAPQFQPNPQFNPQFQPQPPFFRQPTQQPPAFDRTTGPGFVPAAAPSPVPFRPEQYPRQPETPAIPITPSPPPVVEHHGDIITASSFKPQPVQPSQQPQIFPGKLQMMRRPSTPVQPPVRPTVPTRLQTPTLTSPASTMSTVNPFLFRQPQLPFMRFSPVPPVVYPNRPQMWNPYEAAAMSGTPFMLVRTYLVPMPQGALAPTPVVPSAPVAEPQRVAQPEPTVSVKTTTVAEETTTIEEKEVPTTVVTKA